MTQLEIKAELRRIAAACLAARMANPSRDEFDGLSSDGTFASYGDAEYGARRSIEMAETLWAFMARKGWCPALSRRSQLITPKNTP
jgi:hypothetical protein